MLNINSHYCQYLLFYVKKFLFDSDKHFSCPWTSHMLSCNWSIICIADDTLQNIIIIYCNVAVVYMCITCVIHMSMPLLFLFNCSFNTEKIINLLLLILANVCSFLVNIYLRTDCFYHLVPHFAAAVLMMPWHCCSCFYTSLRCLCW